MGKHAEKLLPGGNNVLLLVIFLCSSSCQEWIFVGEKGSVSFSTALSFVELVGCLLYKTPIDRFSVPGLYFELQIHSQQLVYLFHGGLLEI